MGGGLLSRSRLLLPRPSTSALATSAPPEGARRTHHHRRRDVRSTRVPATTRRRCARASLARVAAAGGGMAVRVARDDLLALRAERRQETRPAVAVLLLVALQVGLVDAAVAALPELRVPGE